MLLLSQARLGLPAQGAGACGICTTAFLLENEVVGIHYMCYISSIMHALLALLTCPVVVRGLGAGVWWWKESGDGSGGLQAIDGLQALFFDPPAPASAFPPPEASVELVPRGRSHRIPVPAQVHACQVCPGHVPAPPSISSPPPDTRSKMKGRTVLYIPIESLPMKPEAVVKDKALIQRLESE